MNIDSPEAKDFLIELYSMTEGDTARQVSMHDVGERLGMEKNAISAISEDLIIDQLVELKTLSGGIGITSDGLTALQKEGLISAAPTTNAQKLGKGPVLDESDLKIIDHLLSTIKNAVGGSQVKYAQIEEIVIDIKTLEIQLLSPRPKLSIVIEVFKSLHTTLQNSPSKEIAKAIGNLF